MGAVCDGPLSGFHEMSDKIGNHDKCGYQKSLISNIKAHSIRKNPGLRISGSALHNVRLCLFRTQRQRREAVGNQIDPEEVDRLQDILYYRALGVELARIKECLDDPSFDRLAALRNHLAALEAEQERLKQLIRSVKDTIGAEERNEIMSDEQKFEAFKQRAVAHNEEVYGAEIRAKYGDQEVDEANAAVMNLTQAQYQEWTELGREIQERLEAAVQAGLSPKGEEGKEITALHRRWLTITGNRYDPARHRGIAELYVMDERFTAYYDKQIPGCARFLRDAVAHWVK